MTKNKVPTSECIMFQINDPPYNIRYKIRKKVWHRCIMFVHHTLYNIRIIRCVIFHTVPSAYSSIIAREFHLSKLIYNSTFMLIRKNLWNSISKIQNFFFTQFFVFFSWFSNNNINDLTTWANKEICIYFFNDAI